LVNLKLDELKPNPWNCNFLTAEEKERLKQQLKEAGPERTPPIIVRKKGSIYEIIDGEQRWRIAKELGWQYIRAIIMDADDPKAKTLCVSFNRWRGRLNWFKLHDVMKKDIEAGVDVYEVYGETLSDAEIKKILSLGNLIPSARRILEESLKKYPEMTLEQLYLLSLFPKVQQEGMAKEFRTPAVIAALKDALASFIAEKTAPSRGPEEEEEEEETKPTAKTIAAPKAAKKRSGKTKPGSTSVTGKTKTKRSETKKAEKKIGETVVAVVKNEAFKCECGREYLVDWLKRTVAFHKKNGLHEYVSMRLTFLRVKCPRCEAENDYAVEGRDKMKIRCWRCKLEGTLDVDGKKAQWAPVS